ncbi:MAG: M23 family metallopeptidase [Salinivirgaceae bacterium]|jgi:murein DD-endopeptidase MepM/ murein hydrolase activator NlpD|nr:M23 family metallopeptidase [Salinivirgaceae bacterium]
MGHTYFLDNEKLVFQKERISFKQRAKIFSKYLVFGGGLALILWSLFFTGVIDSPEKYFLQKKNGNLVSEVSNVNAKFDDIANQLLHVQKRDDNFYRVISEIEPLPFTVRQAGFGGIDNYTHLSGFVNSDLLIELSRKSDILINQLRVQSKSYDTVIYFAQSKHDSLLSVPGILPISPADFHRISDPFGIREHPITGKVHKHTGIDLAASRGKKIHSAGNGVVVDIRKSHSGYGNRVIIKHGYGFKTLYAHMNEIYVKKGDKVSRGESVGTVGNTGSSTGPHLHYEVIYNNVRRNPKFYFIEDLTDHEFREMTSLLSVNN